MNGEVRPIRIVSAILAYTRGSIDVGEPLAEVADDGGAAGLPPLCLAEARWMVDEGCCVLSARPGIYGGLAGGGPIIEA